MGRGESGEGTVSVAAFVALCLPYNLRKLQFREIKEKHKTNEIQKNAKIILFFFFFVVILFLIAFDCATIGNGYIGY